MSSDGERKPLKSILLNSSNSTVKKHKKKISWGEIKLREYLKTECINWSDQESYTEQYGIEICRPIDEPDPYSEEEIQYRLRTRIIPKLPLSPQKSSPSPRKNGSNELSPGDVNVVTISISPPADDSNQHAIGGNHLAVNQDLFGNAGYKDGKTEPTKVETSCQTGEELIDYGSPYVSRFMTPSLNNSPHMDLMSVSPLNEKEVYDGPRHSSKAPMTVQMPREMHEWKEDLSFGQYSQERRDSSSRFCEPFRRPPPYMSYGDDNDFHLLKRTKRVMEGEMNPVLLSPAGGKTGQLNNLLLLDTVERRKVMSCCKTLFTDQDRPALAEGGKVTPCFYAGLPAMDNPSDPSAFEECMEHTARKDRQENFDFKKLMISIFHNKSVVARELTEEHKNLRLILSSLQRMLEMQKAKQLDYQTRINEAKAATKPKKTKPTTPKGKINVVNELTFLNFIENCVGFKIMKIIKNNDGKIKLLLNHVHSRLLLELVIQKELKKPLAYTLENLSIHSSGTSSVEGKQLSQDMMNPLLHATQFRDLLMAVLRRKISAGNINSMPKLINCIALEIRVLQLLRESIKEWIKEYNVTGVELDEEKFKMDVVLQMRKCNTKILKVQFNLLTNWLVDYEMAIEEEGEGKGRSTRKGKGDINKEIEKDFERERTSWNPDKFKNLFARVASRGE